MGAAVLVCALLVLLALSRAQWDWRTFSWLGTRFAEGDPQGTTGYDGQFFYYIAVSGLGAVPQLDQPPYRFQRILYPVLARVLALGRPQDVAVSLVLINAAAIPLTVYFLARLLHERRRHALYSLVYVAWVGTLIGLRFNLSEPLTMLLGVTALWAAHRDRWDWARLVLLGAVLSKELGLVFAGGLALYALAQRRYGRALLIGGLPTLLYGGWFVLLNSALPAGNEPNPATDISLMPFNGFFYEDNPAEQFMLLLWLVLPTVALLGAAVWRTWKRRALSWQSALMLTAGAFVLVMPGAAWLDPVAAYRVATPLVVAGLLFVSAHYPRRLFALAMLWSSSSVLYLALQASIPP